MGDASKYAHLVFKCIDKEDTGEKKNGRDSEICSYLVKSLKLLGNQTGGFRALQCIVWWSLHTVSTKEIFRGNCYWESYSSVTIEGIMKFLCLVPKLHFHITHSDKTERKSFLLYIYLKGFHFTFPFSYISFGCLSVSV